MTTDGTDATSESEEARHSTKRNRSVRVAEGEPVGCFLSGVPCHPSFPTVSVHASQALVRVHHRAVERAGVHEVVVRARADHAPSSTTTMRSAVRTVFMRWAMTSTVFLAAN